jgi:hypothetical protein
MVVIPDGKKRGDVDGVGSTRRARVLRSDRKRKVG